MELGLKGLRWHKASLCTQAPAQKKNLPRTGFGGFPTSARWMGTRGLSGMVDKVFVGNVFHKVGRWALGAVCGWWPVGGALISAGHGSLCWPSMANNEAREI